MKPTGMLDMGFVDDIKTVFEQDARGAPDGHVFRHASARHPGFGPEELHAQPG